MKAQAPAEGIMKTHDWGHSKTYKISCDCSNPDHDLDVEVESEDIGVNVHTYVTIKTDCWSEPIKVNSNIENDWLQEIEWAYKGFLNSLLRKLKLTWILWTQGYIRAETTITMGEQAALNYAETLKTAIKDVKEFRNQRYEQTKNS